MSAAKRKRVTTAAVPTSTPVATTPVATEMRELLGWVAANVQAITGADVGTYEVNALRSQILQLFALANDVERLEWTAGSLIDATDRAVMS